MSIRIDQSKCVGCKKCINVCPGSLLAADESSKAFIKRPYECWGCTACLKECSAGAIALILGPDMEGRGEYLTVKKEGTVYIWEVDDGRGHKKKMISDTKRANEY